MPTDQSPPRCVRRSEGKVLGGVASGVADHLGLGVLAVRLAFVALTFVGGLGTVLYAALWMFLPQESAVAGPAPGTTDNLDALNRRGLRKGDSRSRREDAGQVVAVVSLGAGALLLMQTIGGVSANVFWPIVVGAVGLALLWRQADEAQRKRWAKESPAMPSLAPLLGGGGLPMLLRTGFGLLFVLGAAIWMLASSGGMGTLAQALLALFIGLTGLALITGPWVWRLVGDLSEERQERIRSQERADMAAHLHDSVLQTLALIQKQAGDQWAVQRLARAQERELRSWLYGGNNDADTSLKSALSEAAAEVEDHHGVPVEVVTVGDLSLDDGGVTALLRAAREAMVNAAKHSGAPKIDVYVEVEPERVEAFVRDRGSGFDTEAVPEDRFGVRNSIHERMARHAGKAEVKSAPGEGTEVRLVVDRDLGGTQ